MFKFEYIKYNIVYAPYISYNTLQTLKKILKNVN